MPTIDSIRDSVTAGERISSAEALWLLESVGIHDLAQMASLVRFRNNPSREITYIIDRNINYTNICNVFCKFCAFYRTEKHTDKYTLSFQEIGAKIEEAITLGASRILLQGGHNPKLDINYYEEMFRFIKSNYPIRNHALGPPEICHIAQVSEISVAEVLDRLIVAGLDSLPGGGAEILTDATRNRISPRKCTADEWMTVMREAHLRRLPSTATMMLGVGETLAERVEHFERVRNLQDETGGFTSFIPWTFQPGNTALEGRVAETDSVDYLRTLAVARIYFDNIRHIQLSYVTQGDRVAQVAMFFGADDYGSTMIEENVVSAAGTHNLCGEDNILRFVRECGFEPRLRDDSYEAYPPKDLSRPRLALAPVA